MFEALYKNLQFFSPFQKIRCNCNASWINTKALMKSLNRFHPSDAYRREAPNRRFTSLFNFLELVLCINIFVHIGMKFANKLTIGASSRLG